MGELLFDEPTIEIADLPPRVHCLQEDLSTPGRFYLVTNGGLHYIYRLGDKWDTQTIINTTGATCVDGTSIFLVFVCRRPD